MGHTNYWERQPELPAAAFAAAVADCKTIMKKLRVPLAGRDGTGRAIFHADLIAFNGRSPEGCETFVVEQTTMARDGERRVFGFCKTVQKPYDLAVQVALIVLKHHLGDKITVASDGSDTEWQRAREACQKWLGYGDDFRLE